MCISDLSLLEKKYYLKLEFVISNTILHPESKEYNACSFRLNQHTIIYRKSKITPKKTGQFVTFWKRNSTGKTEPYHENDDFDFFVINCQTTTHFGQFVFPKSVLIQKGIIFSTNKEGKRGFRVYPNWEISTSKQAQKTQAWQNNYFIELSENMDITTYKSLYSNK